MSQPNIVILDAHTANPGDLDWSALEALGHVSTHPRTAGEQVADRCKDAQIVLTNKVPVGGDLMAELPDLKYVGVLATGYNVVDVEAAKKHGVTVTNIPAYSTETTAQHAMALLLELTNHVGHHARDSGDRWPESEDFAYWDKPLVELDGLTMGIVGFGAIGEATARRAKAFGMNLLLHTRSPDKHREAADRLGGKFVDLDTLLAKSDVVSLHAPLTPETKHLIDAAALAKMKKSAYLINCARGPVVDEAALAEAVKSGTIAGAGVDVTSTEPPAADNPILNVENILVTPHQAWAARAARERLIAIAAENVKAFLDGRPQNVVS